MNTYIITIPLYKETLNSNELISLNRIRQLFKDYQLVFLAPDQLDLSTNKIFLNNSKISVKYFEKKYFSSIQGYNKLLLSPFFYKLFLDYEFILIYQLDAFIFQNNLHEWCTKSYDYIGAPWYDTSNSFRFYQKMAKSNNLFINCLKNRIDFNKGEKIHVGNGGLSLRKVKTFYNISKWLQFIEPNLFKYKINEDFVWSILVTKYFKKFRVPTFEEALKFSVEENPKTSLELLGGNLPFGCHAWEKHDINVWRPIFRTFGYKI